MVIPIHDSNPTHRTPVVTYALILANVAVFLIEPVSGFSGAHTACSTEAFFRHWAAIPRELVDNMALPVTAGRDLGGSRCAAVAPTYDKVPALSVLTAMFLHGGWLHLLGNMLYLYVFGNNVEDRLGRLRYLLFYLGCGYAATYGFAAFVPDAETTLVGASGAIAGVLGGYLWLFPRARVVALMPFLFFLPFRFPAWLVLGSWFLIQYLYFQGAGVSDEAGVAYGAHVIGFLVGLLLVAMLRRHRPRPRPYVDPRDFSRDYRRR